MDPLPTTPIEFNINELNVLLQLIHLATQARGLEVAESAVVLSKKIQDAGKKLGSTATNGAAHAQGNGQQSAAQTIPALPASV